MRTKIKDRPSIVKGEPFKDYLKKDRLNFHTLQDWDTHKLAKPSEETTAMIVGRGAHSFILPKQEFEKEFDVADAGSRKAKSYIEMAEGSPKSILLRTEMETIEGMNEAIENHPVARELIKEGEPETSLYWSEEIEGKRIYLKSKIDNLKHKKSILVDLKTTSDASPREFPKDMARYGTGKQMAFYQRACRACLKDWYSPVVVAVEKKPPHLIGIYTLDAESQNLCRNWVDAKLEEYSRWLQEPDDKRRVGYDPKIHEVSLPRWAFYE